MQPRMPKADLPCVRVRLRWGSSALVDDHLCPARTFRIGSTPGCDAVVPLYRLGLRSLPVLLCGPGWALRALAPMGAAISVKLPGQPAMRSEQACRVGLLQPCPDVPGAQQVWLFPGLQVHLRLGGNRDQPGCGPYRETDCDDAFHIALEWVDQERIDGLRCPALPGWRAAVAACTTVLLHTLALLCIAYWMPWLAPASFEGDDSLLMREFTTHCPWVRWSADADEEPQRPAGSEPVEELPGERVCGGESGTMGHPDGPRAGGRYAVMGPADNPDPHVARARGDSDWASVLAFVGQPAGAGPAAVIAPWGREDSLGTDPIEARGRLFAQAASESRGTAGFGQHGQDLGGPARFSRSVPACETPAPSTLASLVVGTPVVKGAGSVHDLRGLVQSHLGRLRGCLGAQPRAARNAYVLLRATIGEDGHPLHVEASNASNVALCLAQTLGTLDFPGFSGEIAVPIVISDS